MKQLTLLSLLFATVTACAQTPEKLWSESDRKFLLDNLKRSRDELINETRNLSEAQWNFKAQIMLNRF